MSFGRAAWFRTYLEFARRPHLSTRGVLANVIPRGDWVAILEKKKAAQMAAFSN